MLLVSMERHVALVHAALIDGKEFQGYRQDYADKLVEGRVRELFHLDLTTEEGREAMYLLITAGDGKQMRYKTAGVGKKLHAAIILYLMTH